MTQRQATVLTASHGFLRALIFLNLGMGVLILGLLTASLVAPAPVMGALGVEPDANTAPLVLGMRAIMALGLLAVPFGHAVLVRLGAIIATVRQGDPFVPVNAARLQAIAWSVLALELLRLAIGGVARFSSAGALSLDFGWTLAVTRWITLLFCFVLAGVFAHGTRLRDDLEGTV